MTAFSTRSGPAGAAPSELLAPWRGRFGGLPPFDKVRVEDLQPALEAGMAAERADVDAIIRNPAPPDFENTIAALERAGRARARAETIYYIWTSTLATPAVQAVESAMEPKLAAHGDRILQNADLFARIEAVHADGLAALTPEQRRLVWLYWTRFQRAGARLSPTQKARVAAINEELAHAYTSFSQNLLADETEQVLFLSEAQLSGLPQDVRAAAGAAARERGRPGEYAILNTASAADPFMTYADDRNLREQVWRTFYGRGDGGAHDNNPLIRRILKLRAERAKLMGFATHAHWRLKDASMAGTPEAAMDLMLRVWPSAVARVREEVAEMQAIADREGAGFTIAPWDYRYYAEKVRAERYDLDMNAVKPYLQLEKLREGMFWVAGRLYGLEFSQVADVAVQHPDVRVWDVRRQGLQVGLWWFDPYARPGKRSGAWMSDYRAQERFDGEVAPIVSNNSNFVKPEPGEPVLISWDDAVTMFHEFGHALHGLNSNVTYPSLSGTNVFRDYVEFPSQINEHWLATREVLSRFALHHETGEPMPQALAERIARAHRFRQGFNVTEYLSAALIDMKMHLAGDADIDPAAFEREELARLGMPRELPMRHRPPQFQHVFASDGYSAGYYSYLWAETLALDAFEAFTEAGGPYDEEVARRLRDDILAVGNSIDPAQAWRNFRGRDPDVGAYLRDKGFA